MNRYPLWKYAILAVALLVGLLYTIPNFYGEAPAVQVSSGKATLKLDAGFAPRVQKVLDDAKLAGRLRAVRRQHRQGPLRDTDTQIKAKDALWPGAEPRRE